VEPCPYLLGEPHGLHYRDVSLVAVGDEECA